MALRSSVTPGLSRAKSRAGGAGGWDVSLRNLGAGEKGIEIGLPHRPLAQTERDGRVVETTGPEATIEMPQSRNDHPDDRHVNVRARLIEDEEIMSSPRGELDAGQHLVAAVELREILEPRPPEGRFSLAAANRRACAAAADRFRNRRLARAQGGRPGSRWQETD